MNDAGNSIWNDVVTLASISAAGGIVRRLALGEKASFLAYAVSAATATFAGVAVGLATKDYVNSVGLWLGIVALASYTAPEILALAIIAVRKKGKSEIKKL